MRPDTSMDIPKHWGIIGTIGWGTLIGGVFVLVQTILVVVFAAYSSPNPSPDGLHALLGNGNVLSLAIIGSAVVCVPVVFGVAALKRGSLISSYLGIRPVSF